MSTAPVAVDTPIGEAELGVLQAFHEAGPALLEARALQARVDRKFVLPRQALPALLARLRDGHLLLTAAGQPAASYDTIYFDTAEGRMYDDHRRGRLPRFKVRVRHQAERRMTFLEVKRKGHDGRTVKARLARRWRDAGLDELAADFVADHSPFTIHRLSPALHVCFRRATLLSVDTEERLTIDWGFEFRRDAQSLCWPGVAIVEIKQRRLAHLTPAVTALRALLVREARISKFCVGLAALSREHSAGAFRPALRAIARLTA